MKTLEIKWTVSKGRNTYGYNICSLYENGTKQTSCNGGGYDMQGTCLGEWINKNYKDRLCKLYSPNFYGLKFIKKTKTGKYIYLKRYTKDCEIVLDGACGESSMLKIARAIKLAMKQTKTTKNTTVFIVED